MSEDEEVSPPPASETTAPTTEEPKTTTEVKRTAPETKGKGKKVVALGIILIIIVLIILAVAFMGDDLFGKKPSTTISQPTPVTAELIKVGTPGATATVSEEGAIEAAMEETEEEEIAYVFCEELGTGDKVTTEGDPDKYIIDGPTWFVYIDQNPEAFFEHDVKYIFIDASTGEKKEFKESWPPDVNGKNMIDAAKDCGGATEIHST